MKTEIYKYTNRLINESSPYLIQHAHNPVNWYSWGDEAFKKALLENKPIFLSIGYSTCHWCHVMEHESFEDETVAELMNRAYISIKVDREERPDIDAFFMDAALMMNHRGGWPLNLILTPDRKPFFSATYIPKNGNSYAHGMTTILPQIERIWKERPEELTTAAEQLTAALKRTDSDEQYHSSAGIIPSVSSDFDTFKLYAYNELRKLYDPEFGGFGVQPKFPQAQNVMFLLRHYKNTGETEALGMAEKTLTLMRGGGFYDQIGYGFHRYSTDRYWLLPHFEKMLYDQAMQILAYSEAYQLTGNALFKRTAEEVIEYVLRDISSPRGGFFSAEDADSEDGEGKFYLWTYNDFMHLLSASGIAGERWVDFYNISEHGNFADEVSGKRKGENILNVDPENLIGGSARLNTDEIEEVRRLLFDERETRIRPHKDDKILTDWNGLMIFALARASWILGNDEYLKSAKKAAKFIIDEMKHENGSLLHSYRNGRGKIPGMIDDYAFFIRGVLELYRSEFDPLYIREAKEIADYVLENLEDSENGGFYLSDKKQTDLPVRKKNLMDNAIPSGNSVMYENLMQLFKITGEPRWREAAEGILKTASDKLLSYPSAFGMLLAALEYSGKNGREIVVAGDAEAAAEMIDVVNSHFLPGSVVILKTPENESVLSKTAACTANYDIPGNGNVSVYVCRDFTCGRPIDTAGDLMKLLEQ